MASEYLTSTAAARLVGVSASGWWTLTSRARRAGVDLTAPRETWPDHRTPLYDADKIRAYLARRPGRGANFRKPRAY